MTVSTPTNNTRLTSTGGQTVFTYTFEQPTNITSAEIKVRVNNVIQSSGYTVNLTTKQVTFTSGLTDGDVVLIYRALDKYRNTDFPNKGTIRSAVLNSQGDRAIYYIQDETFRNEGFTIQWGVPLGTESTYTLLQSAYNGFTIDGVVYQSSSGTSKFTIAINGSDEADLDEIPISSSEQTKFLTTPINVNPHDKITIELTEVFAPEDVSICFWCSKIL